MAEKVSKVTKSTETKRRPGRPKKAAQVAAQATQVESVESVQAAQTKPAIVTVALNFPTQLSFEIPGNRRVTLNGNAEMLRGKGQGQIPMGAFGLTQVKAEDWEYIQKAYKHMRVFRNGLCFATARQADAEAEAGNRAKTRHGREPLPARTRGTEEGTAPTA